jgi:small-conductance mechanosensitive channel
MTTLTILVLLCLPIYFVPLFVALTRDHRQKLTIGIINLLAGWTFLGWVVALAWACTTDTEPRQRTKMATFVIILSYFLIATIFAMSSVSVIIDPSRR